MKDTWPRTMNGVVELKRSFAPDRGPPPSPGWLRLRRMHRLNRHTLYTPVGRSGLTALQLTAQHWQGGAWSCRLQVLPRPFALAAIQT